MLAGGFAALRPYFLNDLGIGESSASRFQTCYFLRFAACALRLFYFRISSRVSVFNFGDLQFERFALFGYPFDVTALERLVAACFRFAFSDLIN